MQRRSNLSWGLRQRIADDEAARKAEDLKKPFAATRDNDCGYGVDYFNTEAEQQEFAASCHKSGTRVTLSLTKDLVPA